MKYNLCRRGRILPTKINGGNVVTSFYAFTKIQSHYQTMTFTEYAAAKTGQI